MYTLVPFFWLCHMKEKKIPYSIRAVIICVRHIAKGHVIFYYKLIFRVDIIDVLTLTHMVWESGLLSSLLKKNSWHVLIGSPILRILIVMYIIIYHLPAPNNSAQQMLLSPFTDEETKAQRWKVISLRSKNWNMTTYIQPKWVDPQGCTHSTTPSSLRQAHQTRPSEYNGANVSWASCLW